jgi:NitT/TauT family transport system substrate-binding protein
MKKLYALFLLLAGSLVFSACSKETTENKAESTVTESSAETTDTTEVNTPDSSEATVDETAVAKEINFGILPAESAIPIILAKEKGFFEEVGIEVSIKAFSSPNDRNVAIQAQELDATIADVMTGATFVDNGIPMRITSDISEDFKILSSPDSGITTMAELSGKNISLVPNFILEYIMDQFAIENGFTYEIVEIPSFSGRAEALMSNQIDGVVYTEPQAQMLVAQGAHLLGSSKEAGIKGGTILFTKDMIENHSEEIKRFYQGYNKAIDYMNATDASSYSEVLTSYQFPDAITDYLSSMTGDFQYAGIISQEQFDSIVAWTVNKGLIDRSYAYDELTDFSMLP